MDDLIRTFFSILFHVKNKNDRLFMGVNVVDNS